VLLAKLVLSTVVVVFVCISADMSALSARLLMDLDDLPNTPIKGLKDVVLMTIEECFACAQQQSAEIAAMDLEGNIFCALMAADHIISAGDALLTRDEAAAIHLYTQESPLYKTLNAYLRDRDRRKLKPLMPFLKLLLTALHKLPPLKTNVYRGVKLDLSAKHPKGKQCIWWSFSSTTASANVLENPMFLGKKGKRTMFSIEIQTGVNIKPYSAIPSEDEILLCPGTVLEVTSVAQLADDLHLIQMKQVPKKGLIDL
jgi:hypothetical protein